MIPVLINYGIGQVQNIGIVKSIIDIDKVKTLNILKFLKNKRFTNAQIKKNDLIKFFKKNLKNFEHDELNKNLDEKM